MHPLRVASDLEGMRDSALALVGTAVLLLVVLACAFAVYALALRARTNARERRWRRLVARWQEPVLNALLDPDRAGEVHARVAPADRLRFVRFVLEYSRRVRGEERETLRSLALPYLGPLEERSTSQSVEVRTRAIQTLGSLGIPEFAKVVLGALEDPSPVVAMVAARSLCRKEHPEYAPAVLRRLDRFDLWSREFLAAMLVGVGPDAAPALRVALADREQPPRVRAVAADALRLLRDLEAGDAAVAALDPEGEDDPELTASLLRLLATVGIPDHLPVIRARCTSTDPTVRAAACGALGTLAEDEDQQRLLGALSDPSPWVAMRAAQGLIAAGATPLLRDLADSDHPRATLAQQVLLEAGPL